MEREIREAVEQALRETFPEAAPVVRVDIAIPREKEHGDYSTTASLSAAKALRKAPRDVAGVLAAALSRRDDLFASVEVAGPGFVNFRLSPERLRRGLAEILRAGPDWGRSDAGKGERVMVEYVSANPTGPLNVVNARAAAFGGALTRLLAVAGHDASAEFYVNDLGGQIDLLGASLLARYREIQGRPGSEIPEEGYQGAYLRDIAESLAPAATDGLLAGKKEAEQASDMSRIAVLRVLEWQRKALEAYGATFDRWFRQSELYPDAVERALSLLRDRGHVFEAEGAVWFRSTGFGDDQDRVLVRANGEPTYFLADLAYHASKHERGFARAIDIWGPDHHGYIARMQAGAEAMGFGKGWLEVLIVQQVNLLADGKPVKMSKRAGEFITLEDLLSEVGKDTAIFFFLMRRAESHLDFDLDLARKESDENPVFYVKYAHARISGILRKAAEEGAPDPEGSDLGILAEPQEIDLIKALVQYPSLLAGAAAAREPHRVTQYLREVAQAFHLFYHHCRVVGENRETTRARISLTRGARSVLANGLALLGVEAPERM